MKRRTFLRTGAIAGASAALLPFAFCREIQAGGPTPPVDLSETGVTELQQLMQSGRLSARAIAQWYLDRIKAIDQSGHALRSVVEINPDALAIAEALDKERSRGAIRGPLHGIPILIKDNIDTADKMQTTAGSLALEGNIAREDAFVVKKLREAGAVILGKTNLSEWANFRSSRSSSGWSSRGGQTKNPYILDRSPCGSSSGSAVAVAAGLCAVAVGTETNGSIACPASINGVVGIKPTVGLVSRSGIIPISSTQDTAGPFGRTVRDAAVLLGAMAGVDASDAPTRAGEGHIEKDYTAFLDKNGLQGKRIGVEKSLLRQHEAIDALLNKALEQMRQAGATIVEVEFLKTYNSVGADELKVLEYEFKDGLNRYLSKANGKVKSLEELIAFNKANEAKMMPFFKQEILENSQQRGDLNSKEYLKALASLHDTVRGAMDRLFKEQQLAALCGPATGASWCADLINGDAWTGYGAYGPAAVAGYPSVTVPMGLVAGLPVGLAFMGAAYDEPELIAIAYAYEQVSQQRVAPNFLATLPSAASGK